MRRILFLTLTAAMLILAVVGCSKNGPTTSNEDNNYEPGSKFEQLGTANDMGQ